VTPWLIHAANLAFLVSFLVRDILALRLLSVAGGSFLLASFLLADPVSWASVGWNVVFSCINGAQITRLLLERRPVRLSRDERALSELAFAQLAPRDVRRLAQVAHFDELPRGEVLAREGEKPRALWLVVEGAVRVESAGAQLTRLCEGRFVGEMCFLTGALPRASAIVDSERARVAAFDVERLRALLDSDATLRAAMQQVLGSDLASKLRAAHGARD
jgi:CRP-like cAMP-binding protein